MLYQQQLLFVTAVLGCLIGGQISAQESDPVRIPTPLPPALPLTPLDRIDAAALPAPQGVLVMTDGRVFQGTLREQPGGYRVEQAETYNMVPFEYVAVTAPNLNEAYRKLRESVPRHTVESHLKLAEWCRAQGMLAEAKLETASALRLEPLRTEARQLLKELEAATNPLPVHEQVERHASMTMDGFLKPNERALQGVSREAMVTFVRHVQPLLMNKCANAQCHGGNAEREFSLQMVRGMSQQTRVTEANLAAVLKQLQPTPNGNLPLLTKPREQTDAHRRVFTGVAAERQWKTLTDWVEQVAGPASVVPQGQLALAAGKVPPTLQSGPVGPAEKTASAQSPAGSESELNPAQFLQEVLQQERPDPFDPEVFNRRRHGRTAAELRKPAVNPAEGAVERERREIFGDRFPLPTVGTP